MRFRVLGSVEVESAGGVVSPGRRQERCVLGILLLNVGRAVPVGRLCDLLWEGDPPEGAKRLLHSHIARIRATLAAADGEAHGVALLSRADGYVLRAEPDSVDAHHFKTLVARAATIADLTERAEVLAEALALWRGTALEDAATDRQRDLLVPDLAELRLHATEESIAAGIALGRYRTLVSDLVRLTAVYPTRERLIELHMLALYRAGRVADALDVYSRARTDLADALGLDPGPRLRRLQQAILRGDEIGLDAGTADGDGTRADAVPTPHCLPRDIGDFTGREEALAHLVAVAREAPVIAIDGMPGVGKTALAVRLAHRVAQRYPDGQLAIDLHGHSEQQPLDVAVALETLLRQLGVTGERVPDGLPARVELWRSELARRRVLLLLDNVGTGDQVATLLPTGTGCLTLITSRRRLTGLDGIVPFSLDVLTADEAVALVRRVAGERVAADPEAAAEVVRRCGYLTLAVRLAAARLAHRPKWTVRDLAARLGDGGHTLREFAVGGRSVAAAFGLSYHHLSPDAGRMLRVLGLHPGTDTDGYAAARLADLDLAEAQRVLDELVDAQMLDEPTAGRYQMHDLIREYAAALALDVDPEPEQRAAVDRLLSYYVYAAAGAAKPIAHLRTDAGYEPAGGFPLELPEHTPESARTWFDRERRNLVGAVRRCVEGGWGEYAWRLARAAWWFLYTNGYHDDCIATHELALTALGTDRGEVAAALHNYLAASYYRIGRWDEAFAHIDEAIEIRTELGDGFAVGRSVVNRSRVLLRYGRYAESLDAARTALRYATEPGGNPIHVADCHYGIGLACIAMGNYPAAEEHLRRGLKIVERSGISTEVGTGYANLAQLALHQKDYVKAIDLFTRALPLRAADDTSWVAESLWGLGTAHRRLGDLRRARQYHDEALAMAQRKGDQYSECNARIELAATLYRLGELDEATRQLRPALQIAERLQFAPQQARALDGLAGVLGATEPDTADTLLGRADAIYEKLEAPRPGWPD